VVGASTSDHYQLFALTAQLATLLQDALGSAYRLDRELEATLMPSYESRLGAAELDDLVAYLATLRGAK